MTADEVADVARRAALAFAERFGYSAEQIRAVAGAPVLGPVADERQGRAVTVYRWIGGGRGSAYIQVEVGEQRTMVFGAHADDLIGPWEYRGS